jgi:hypothetical protein
MKPFLIPLGCLLLPACSETVISNGRIGGLWGDRDMPVTYTTADLRMISERPVPLDRSRKLLCIEPSPDVAKALAAAAEASAKATVGADSGQLGGQASSAEAVLELAGRSTALLGLRDGLFQACEAYANGIIGDNAYALVLSRYGQLMVTLFLAQDIQNAAPAETNTVAASLDKSGSGGSGDGSDGTGGGSGQGNKTPSSSVDPNNKQKQGAAHGTHTSWPDVDLDALVHKITLAQDAGKEQQNAPTGGSAGQKKKTTTIKQTPSPSPATAAPVDAPAEIAALGQGYFDLDKNDLHLLMTTCINEFDETRAAAAVRKNEFLREYVCKTLEDPKLLSQLLTAQTQQPATTGKMARH